MVRLAAMILALLPLVLSARAHADEEAWVTWRHDHGRSFERVSTWPDAKECDAHLPRFAVDVTTLLVTNGVPGWCCLPESIIDPLASEDRDAVKVFACEAIPAALRAPQPTK